MHEQQVHVRYRVLLPGLHLLPRRAVLLQPLKAGMQRHRRLRVLVTDVLTESDAVPPLLYHAPFSEDRSPTMFRCAISDTLGSDVGFTLEESPDGRNRLR